MKIKVNTKSNYRHLNGRWLDVIEAKGDTIQCWIPNEFKPNELIPADFKLSEIVEMEYNR